MPSLPLPSLLPSRLPSVPGLPAVARVPVQWPHRFVGDWLNERFTANVKSKFFRGMEFEAPTADPGWFGPESRTWYVHSHTPALIFGLQCASYLERLDPSIYWMGMHHSRLVENSENGLVARIDLEGVAIRLGHSLAFFVGTAYGSTATAERLARTVRSMHHTIKGVRPDGLAYDADDPEWLRWNYATVVWGIATAHEIYHPKPLRGAALDEYYAEFVRVGHALGGTGLPTSKAETLDCLEEYLPKLGLTYGSAMATGSNLTNPAQAVVDWAIRDTMPSWAARLVMYQPPNPVERRARRSVVWTAINGLHSSMGTAPEFAAAQRRVAGGTTSLHTEPTYVLGSDPEMDREQVERVFAES
ncbi:DUF2236 domain-containing protein [Gordonia sp. HY285]|uniref:oxygenase MpaB family protein n=1 Tax=Gordonia liuliyuniae TaxID=2911517 RepID=UPI001F246441|nr:oxygenase MpaB family protein [Gordonia liuliyuniae]MCF8610240.1 DUF2236 domain-containing protein [Gordonia liuliyuniae]